MDASIFRTLEVSDPALAPEGLRFVTVKSRALGHRADVTLFDPAACGLAPRRVSALPVVVLLHGVYGSHWAWAFKGAAHLTAARLIDERAIAPMAVAMPSDGLWGDGSLYLRHDRADFARWVTDEVLALARATVPGVDERSPVFLAGLSMGGFAALVHGARMGRRKYRAVSAHSAATRLSELMPLMEERLDPLQFPRDVDVLSEVIASATTMPPLRFDCGTTDGYLASNRALARGLSEHGIEHVYEEAAGGHDWAYWRRQLGASFRFFSNAL